MSRVIRISDSIFSRLQAHSIPLVDTPATVIERILDYYEKNCQQVGESLLGGISPGSGLYLAPANEENLDATICNPVPLSNARENLSTQDYNALKKSLKGEEKFRCWAMTKNSLSKFKAMQPGDYVLFSLKGTGVFSYYGQVIHKIRSIELGSALWSVVPNLPWELICFLDNITPIKVPKDELVSSLGYDQGYVVPGIIRVSSERVQNVIKRYGSIGSLISSLSKKKLKPRERLPYTANQKPSKCPMCGSARMASIQYGLPAFSFELKRDIDLGKVVLGGCCITNNDPQWECADCHTRVYREGDAPVTIEEENSR
ncbi:hypothetical protein [Desulfosediminicola ganghwensis]|uniref:hypothetical protein n=1 Tax=Desulfosediminicola ganghwensis TaxID=2569540 RepID=UPI001C3E1C32|nr:hypothetical protein [Desulfosediminicola ganghwensis]